jgi:putative ABC transport system ATP-binding protein
MTEVTAEIRRRPLIVVQRLVKSYPLGGGAVHALRGITFAVERGDFVAIMGASGSGKSTLMNILGCLDLPTRGRYLLDGIDVRLFDEYELAQVRNKKLGFVFQSFNLIPRTSALQNVELPLVYARVKPKERRERALAALRSVGLGKRVHHLPSELSGGQQQRAALARAIVSNPAIVLADEPTGNLDSSATAEILQVLSRMNAQGRTIVLITHEHDVAEACKRTIVLRDGLIIEDTRKVPVTARPPLLLAGVPSSPAASVNLGATA